MTELFVLFRWTGTEPIWAAVTTREHAEDVAVSAAISGGSVELLSGKALAERLYVS